MTTEQVRRAQHTAPFKPFTIHLADGRTFSVQRPELMLISPGGRTVVLAVSDEAFEIIDLFLVTSLTTGNGSTEG